MIIKAIISTLFLLKTDYKYVKLFSSVCKNGKTCYEKGQLSQYWTIIVPYDYC